MKENYVMIFIRPQESPIFTVEEKNIWITYGNSWVAFKDGKIIIKPEKEGYERKHSKTTSPAKD